MIRAEDLRKRYGDRTALDGVSFSVNAGEIVGLLGPNGAGKTTTLSILSGVIDPDSGRASIATHSLATEPRVARRSLGLVPQSLALYPTLTALENLMFWGRIQGMAATRRAQARTRAARGSRPRRSCRRRGRGILRRHDAPAEHRVRHDPLTGGDHARRANRRRRSAIARKDFRGGRAGRASGRRDPLQHALHGRSGAAVQSNRADRSREHSCAGHRPRTDRVGGNGAAHRNHAQRKSSRPDGPTESRASPNCRGRCSTGSLPPPRLHSLDQVPDVIRRAAEVWRRGHRIPRPSPESAGRVSQTHRPRAARYAMRR